MLSVMILTVAIDFPVLSEIDSIKPSRGPEPILAELISPPPIPIIAIPIMILMMSSHEFVALNEKSSHKKKSIQNPTMKMLRNVPNFIYCLSSFQDTPTNTTPITIFQVPIENPNLLWSPTLRTSQG